MLRSSLATAVLSLLGGGAFEKVDTLRGIPIEARTVDGTGFEELRLTAPSKLDAPTMCRALYLVVTDDVAFTPDIASRKVLYRKPDEVGLYDRVKAPLVSERDYAMRMKLLPGEGGTCEIPWAQAPDIAPRPVENVVRMPKVTGAWTVTAGEKGGSRVTYRSYVDLGGAVPSWIARGGTRQAAARDVKKAIELAETKATQLPALTPTAAPDAGVAAPLP